MEEWHELQLAIAFCFSSTCVVLMNAVWKSSDCGELFDNLLGFFRHGFHIEIFGKFKIVLFKNFTDAISGAHRLPDQGGKNCTLSQVRLQTQGAPPQQSEKKD